MQAVVEVCFAFAFAWGMVCVGMHLRVRAAGLRAVKCFDMSPRHGVVRTVGLSVKLIGL